MLKKIGKIVSLVMCFVLVISFVGCASSENKLKGNTDTYVKDDGTVVVDGIEIQDAFVNLQVNPAQVDEISVLDLDVDEILVNCVSVDEISVIEAEVVSLSDEFVYLAYQNFVSYYGEDIDFQKFLTDVAIGGTCIIVCVTLSAVGGPIGTFFGAVITSEFTAATLAIGAAIDAAVSGYLAYQEGGDASYIVGHMLNGVADGFKWSAILAPVSGGFSGINTLRAVNAVKKLDAFSNLSDEAINAVLKNFSKIIKKVAKESLDTSDNALKALYKQVSKELSSEITEEAFLLAVKNQPDITRYIMKYNPFNVSGEVSRALKESFLSRAGVPDDAIETYIKQIQNKTIKRIDDIDDANLRNYIESNLYEFVEAFGRTLSDEYVDECLKEKLGQKAFKAVEKYIATEDNAYCTLIEKIGKDSLDVYLSDAETLLLLQVRFGSRNVNRLIGVSKLYSAIAGNGNVRYEVKEIIDGILKGRYKSLTDIENVSVAAADNLMASRNVLHAVLSDIGALQRNADLLDDLTVVSLARYVDGEAFINALVKEKLNKGDIVSELGQSFYDDLVAHANQVIQCLALQPQMNTTLIQELFVDFLSAEGLSDEVISRILSGVPISEWGDISDHVVKRIANTVATYYQTTDMKMYSGFIREYSEVRASVASSFNKANNITPINGKYAGLIMETDHVFVKAKYGDIYMNEAGYPIFDEYAIARVEFNDLTGDTAADIRKANMFHHGSYETPPGYTWHHVEDGRTMILIPTDLHEAYRHSGGATLIRDGAMLYAQGTVPQKAIEMVEQIKANDGNQIAGYEGGRIWRNIPLNEGDQILPEGVVYREYDVNPFVSPAERGVERIVIGDDGSAYYTDDHYHTFVRIE